MGLDVVASGRKTEKISIIGYMFLYDIYHRLGANYSILSATKCLLQSYAYVFKNIPLLHLSIFCNESADL